MSVDENKAVARRTVDMLDTLEAGVLEDMLSPELAAGWRRAGVRLPGLRRSGLGYGDVDQLPIRLPSPKTRLTASVRD